MNQVYDIFDQWIIRYYSLAPNLQIILGVTLLILCLIALLVIFIFVRFHKNQRQDNRSIIFVSKLNRFYGRVLDTEESLTAIEIKSFWKSLNQRNRFTALILLADYCRINQITSDVELTQLLSHLNWDKISIHALKRYQHSVRIDFISAIFELNLTSYLMETKQADFWKKILFVPQRTDVFEFLGFCELPNLNEWQRLVMVQFFKVYPEEHLPDFRLWFRQEESEGELIAIMNLLTHYKQKPSTEDLVRLLKYENKEIKRAVIKLLGELRLEETEVVLMKDYQFNGLGIREDILQAILQMNSGNAFQFLKKVYKQAIETEEVQLSLQALYCYNDESRSFFLQERENAGRYEKRIFDHVKNSILMSNSSQILINIET